MATRAGWSHAWAATSSPFIKALTDLRAAGVRVAIDDFGTGHSSLARLHELPADIIKLDRSFIQAAAPDDTTSNTTMLELVVALADRLQLELVAEGIETAHQLEVVRDTGCAYAQGYLLGRPRPAPPATRRHGLTTPGRRHQADAAQDEDGFI